MAAGWRRRVRAYTSVPVVVGLVALAPVVAASAEGCSAASPPGIERHYDVADLVAAVEQRQRADRTARLSLRGEVVADAAQLRFTGEGVLQVLPDAVSATFTQVVTQDGAAPQETGFVVLPGAVYLRMPPAPGTEPAKPWVEVDPRSTDPEAQRLTDLATTLTESATPTRTLAHYADAALVADAADDVVDGAPAVRYTLVIDLARAAALERDRGLRTALDQQVRSGLTRVTTTLWLDGDDRPVRSAVRQVLPGIGTVAVTGDFRQWGQPVRIEPPPATQVQVR